MRFIGAAEMTHDIDRLNRIFTGAQALIKSIGLCRMHAQTVHTGVDFQPDIQRTGQLRVFQRLKLFNAVNGGIELMLDQQR
ncbi:hypothetical protein D3C80_1735010 [compost metagenome]